MAKKYDEEGNASIKTVETDKNRKTVFIIGDSIRMGFMPYAQSALQDEAIVISPDENCRNTQHTYISLPSWKTMFSVPEEVKLIYWNNGHWDIAHWDGDAESLNSVEQYTEMLRRIYHRLCNYFPNAKIIFATTSHANPNGMMGVNPRTNEEIIRYNQSALHLMDELGVHVDDLYAYMENWSEDAYSDYVHLTNEGYRLLGEHVAQEIREALTE